MIPLFITRVRSHRCKDTTHTLCSVVFKSAWNLHGESHGVIYPAVYSYTAAYFQFTIILSLFTTYSPLPGLVRLLLLLLLRNMSDQLYSVQFPRNLEIIFLMTFLTLNKMLYITCSIYFATFKRILVTDISQDGTLPVNTLRSLLAVTLFCLVTTWEIYASSVLWMTKILLCVWRILCANNWQGFGSRWGLTLTC